MDAAAIAKAVALATQRGASHVVSRVAENPNTVLLIDADGLNYACAGNDSTMFGTARKRLVERVEELRARSGAGICEMHLTHPASDKAGRYLAATIKPYQGNRSGKSKPKNWALLREYLENYDGSLFDTLNWTDREADDGLAYHSKKYLAEGKEVFLMSADKDLRMVEGVHHVHPEYIYYPQEWWDATDPDGKVYGFKWFLLQVLQGDPVDNIPGLPRLDGKLCGPVRAENYLAGLSRDEAIAAVVKGYKEYYGDDWLPRIQEQSALLWLRTDHDAQEVIEWVQD